MQQRFQPTASRYGRQATSDWRDTQNDGAVLVDGPDDSFRLTSSKIAVLAASSAGLALGLPAVATAASPEAGPATDWAKARLPFDCSIIPGGRNGSNSGG